MIRQFWLINGNDKQYDLSNSNQHRFLSDPQGLGFASEYITGKVGTSEPFTSFSFSLSDLNGEVIFYNRSSAYADYFDFVKFISIDPLYLYYRPTEAQTFFCLVKVTNLEKTEIAKDGALHCPITFKKHTLWYSTYENKITAGTTSEDGKCYPLIRPYKYATPGISRIEVQNQNMTDLPMTIEIVGACTDPLFNVYDEKGIKYGSGRIKGNYDYIYINSSDENEDLILKRGTEVVQDPFNYQDLTIGEEGKVMVTFIKIKPGTSILNFVMDEGFCGKVNLSWRNAYVSV